jgi:hypothetical protein
MMRALILITLLSCCMSLPAVAQDATMQKDALAGKKITNPLLGFAFTAPEGWNIEELGNGYNFYSPAQQSNILVMATTYASRDQLLAAARETTDDGQGTRLVPTGEPFLLSDNGVMAEYSGTWRGEAAQVTAIGLVSPHGGSVMVLSVSSRDFSVEKNRDHAQALARSLSFLTPDTGNGLNLQKRFAGKKLTYLSSYSSGASGGYSSQRFISLCPDGQFVLTGNSSVSMEAAGSFGNSSGVEQSQGNWKVVYVAGQPLLVLSASDGSIHQFEIKMTKDALLLDGRRYFITDDADCH